MNVHHHKSNVELEAILKEVAEIPYQVRDEDCYEEVPANFNALFLLRHAMNHFASTEMTLRQLLDWGFFVEKHGKEVDWEWFDVVLERFGMKQMFQIFNAICVEDLGFEWVIPHAAHHTPHAALDAASREIPGRARNEGSLKERVLNDILEPEFSAMTPKHVWKRIPFKYRRWKANEWKHELCYTDSMKSAFWSGVKNHLMKPASI